MSLPKMLRRSSTRKFRKNAEKEENAMKLSQQGTFKRSSSNRWKKSNNRQKTLKEILKQTTSLAQFRKFLQSEYSHENLEFWFEAEKYKQLSKGKQKIMAGQIFNQYIKENSPSQVNLTARVRTTVEQKLNEPTGDIFVDAQQQIFNLIEGDSFKRFLEKSNEFGE